MNEPIITINGHLLTVGQSMTLRVALENFANSLVADGLGDDDVGVLLCGGYQDRITEIRVLMFTHPPATSGAIVSREPPEPGLSTAPDLFWVDGYWMTTDGTSLVVTELNDPEEPEDIDGQKPGLLRWR